MISNKVTFWQMCTQTSLCSLLLSLEFPNAIRSLALQSKDIQATSKGSDQNTCMHRLVWAFAGRTYHMVGNLMPPLKGHLTPKHLKRAVRFNHVQNGPLSACNMYNTFFKIEYFESTIFHEDFIFVNLCRPEVSRKWNTRLTGKIAESFSDKGKSCTSREF